ncbi:MAG: transporter [Microbacteriaceae bacterium]|nr:transporter [Microbacteriaceae bacterium]
MPVLVGAILAVGAVSGSAAPARAHNSLVASTPEAGATITELPESFSVTTNEDLFEAGAASGGFALQVIGPDGLFYGDGCVDVAGPTMSAEPALGAPGSYTLAWQVISIDGHPVDGQFGFDWAPAAGAEVFPGATGAPVCGESAQKETPPGTATPVPSAAPDTDGGSAVTDDASLATTLWLGAIVAAVTAAAIATALVVRNRRKSV